VFITNVTVLARGTQGGLRLNGTNNFVNNVHFIGVNTTSTGSQHAINYAGGSVSNILVSGLWRDNQNIISQDSSSTTLSDVVFNVDVSSGDLRVQARGVVDTIRNVSTSSQGVLISVVEDGCTVSNVFLEKETSENDLSMGTRNGCRISNCEFRDIASVNGDENHFSNVAFLLGATVGGDRNTFTNCWTQNQFTVSGAKNKIDGINIDSSTQNLSVTGNNNMIVTNVVGSASGSGSNTIAISGTADGNIVSNNQVDVAITDSSSGANAINNNVIF
jgi:hypothetical protein